MEQIGATLNAFREMDIEEPRIFVIFESKIEIRRYYPLWLNDFTPKFGEGEGEGESLDIDGI